MTEPLSTEARLQVDALVHSLTKMIGEMDHKNHEDVYRTIRVLLMRISAIFQALVKRKAVTVMEMSEYSYASAAVGALLETLSHNPQFDSELFVEQFHHNLKGVLTRAHITEHEVSDFPTTKPKGGGHG